MKSDGTPWRPLIHIEDISRAFLAVLEADRAAVHNEVFNVAAGGENYQIREVAEIVQDVVPDSEIALADTAGPDIRNYRVEASKLASKVPAFKPAWNVRRGAEELYAAYTEYGLTNDAFREQLLRVKHIKALQQAGALTDDLRVVSARA